MGANLIPLDIENFQFFCSDKLKSEQLLSDLITKKTSILNVVESLAVVLTNEDKVIRKQGVEFLTWLLSKLPTNFLNDKELVYFSGFYCDRLVDHHSIIPATLQGILSLLNMERIPEKSVAELIHKIFQFVTCQAQLAQDRKTLYLIFKSCSESHYSCIEKTGPDFLYGVLTSMEGETDPQNLLFLFDYLPSLISKLNIDNLTENLFEVLSIYFPVDFTTVKKGDVVITREDLSEGLSNCLTATPKLSSESLSLILEKLESTLKVAKIDSYKLLQRCCLNLDAACLEPVLESLWKIMLRDLIPVMDVNIQSEALKALGCVVSVLGSSETTLKKFLDDVIIAIRSFIDNPADTLFQPAMKILEAMHNQSPIASERTSFELNVLLKRRKNASRTESELIVLITAMVPFIHYFVEETVEIFLPLCFEAVHGNTTALHAAGFVALEKLFRNLGEKFRRSVFQELIVFIQASEKIIPECRQLLRKIGDDGHDFLVFFNELENLLSAGKLSVGVFCAVLETVVQNPSLTDRILGHYVSLGQSEHSAIALESLLNTCENAPVHFLRTLHNTVLTLTTSNHEKHNLSRLSHLLKNVIACQTAAEQTAMLNSANHPLFSKIMETDVILIEGALSALWPKVLDQRVMNLVPKLSATARNSAEPEERESAGRLLAAFVNKLPVNESANILNSVKSDLGDENSVNLFCWILKGAILRGLPGVDDQLNHWFSLLGCTSTSRVAAIGTRRFLQTEPVFLNESCHCTVKYLYKQRLFSYLPRLAKSLQSTPDPILRNNYLLASIELASGVPLQILLTEQSSVVATVSQALQTNEPSVTEPSLELLKTLLAEKHPIFSDHITSLLPVLLKLVHPPSSLPVRRIALQCLFLAGCYPTHLTLPYRTEVIRELLTCLDDRKRIVRSEAVKTRSRWYLIGAVGEDAVFS